MNRSRSVDRSRCAAEGTGLAAIALAAAVAGARKAREMWHRLGAALLGLWRRARAGCFARSAAAPPLGGDSELPLLDASERYQQQVGQELHDGLGQLLTGLAFLASALERKLRERGSDVADDAAWMCNLLNESVAQTRAIARGLHPIGDGERTLADALDALCAQVAAIYGIGCRYLDVSGGGSDRFAPRVAGHLYRIAQEAVTNAVRHGHARMIEIELRAEPATFLLQVWNDGDAPHPADLRAGRGLGLKSMRRRAAAIGAALSFECDGASGFCVVLRLPARAAAEKGPG
jgi:signal transduction histidine kinase